MDLPDEVWIRIGAFADCLAQLEHLTPSLHRRKPSKLLLRRAVERQLGTAGQFEQCGGARVLWPSLGVCLHELAEIWDELQMPRDRTRNAMYPRPSRRHLVYRLKYMRYRILRRQRRFGILALIY